MNKILALGGVVLALLFSSPVVLADGSKTVTAKFTVNQPIGDAFLGAVHMLTATGSGIFAEMSSRKIIVSSFVNRTIKAEMGGSAVIIHVAPGAKVDETIMDITIGAPEGFGDSDIQKKLNTLQSEMEHGGVKG